MIQELAKESNGITQIGIYLAEVVALGGFVFVALKGVAWQLDSQMSAGPKRKRIKFLTSQFLGPSLGMVFFGAGFLAVPSGGIWGWILGGVMGYTGTLVAAWQHNRKKKS